MNSPDTPAPTPAAPAASASPALASASASAAPGFAASAAPATSSAPATTSPGPPAQVGRYKARASTERAILDAILDDVLAGTLSTVVDGRPWVVPMLFARDGDRVLLHGSTGAGALRHVAAGAPATLALIAVDGLVVAHSTFESSANYRSAIVSGHLRELSADDRAGALDKLSERLLPGRTAEVVPMAPKEIAATLAMELPIIDGQWTVKVRSGPPSPPGPDEEANAWCGVIPLAHTAGTPQPAPWSVGEVPGSVVDFVASRPGPEMSA